MAAVTQSPAKKRPRLSLKLNRKTQSNTEQNAHCVNKDDDHSKDHQAQQYDDDQCVIPDEPREMPAPYCGLYNLGNTCYFNSVLQALRYTSGFCDGLKKLADVIRDSEENSESNGSSDSKASKHSGKEESGPLLQLVLKLNKLFDEMSAKESKFVKKPSPDIDMAVYPEEVLSTIRDLNPMFQGYLQHDSQELLCSLLSKLQDASHKVLQIEREQTAKPKKHSKLSLSANKSAAGQTLIKTDENKNETKMDSRNGEQLNGSNTKNAATKTPELLNGHSISASGSSSRNSSASIVNATNEKKSNSAPSTGSGEGRRRKRASSSSKESETDGDQTPQRKVKKKARSLTPSNDSMVNGKGDVTVNGNNSNGNADDNLVNGGGDTKESKSKKKRLGIGRMKVPFNQPTILSKFGFVKKDNNTANGLLKTAGMCNGIGNGKDVVSETNGKCETVSEVENVTSGLVCYNKTNNNSNQSQPHGSNSPTKTSNSPQKTSTKKTISPSSKSGNSIKASTKKCFETSLTSNEDDEVECLGMVTYEDKQLKIVEKMFHGALVLRTRCIECEGFTERREDFQEISVPVQRMEKMAESDEEEHIPGRPNNLSLSWALSEFACAERLTAENKYFCESCHHHTEAERTMLFGALPPILSVQLKRFCAFSGSMAFGGVSKVNDHLATPLSLSLTQWCTKQCGQRKQKYSLYAVVMHSGVSSSSGHYVCYAKIPVHKLPPSKETRDMLSMEDDCNVKKEVWGHFDDERVTIYSDHEFSQVLHPVNANTTTATPYLLFYRRDEN